MENSCMSIFPPKHSLMETARMKYDNETKEQGKKRGASKEVQWAHKKGPELINT